MSEKQHQTDDKFGIKYKPGCLNRHIGAQPKDASGDTCSHRWQAYEQMGGDTGLYNWPKYKPLADKGRAVRTAKKKSKSGKLHPAWYTNWIASPKQVAPDQGSWDHGYKDNFFGPCYRPYWHNAHHIVPNGTLREAISKAAGDLKMLVRKGLNDEGYNLNDKKNMVMLPMDRPVSSAIGLPRHLQTATAWAHKPYSDYVKGKLDESLKVNASELEEHEEPDYETVKDCIETLSANLYQQIINSTSASLDEMPEELEPADDASPAPALS